MRRPGRSLEPEMRNQKTRRPREEQLEFWVEDTWALISTRSSADVPKLDLRLQIFNSDETEEEFEAERQRLKQPPQRWLGAETQEQEEEEGTEEKEIVVENHFFDEEAARRGRENIENGKAKAKAKVQIKSKAAPAEVAEAEAEVEAEEAWGAQENWEAERWELEERKRLGRGRSRLQHHVQTSAVGK